MESMEKRGILKERNTSRSYNIRKPVSIEQRNTKQLMEKRRRARINSCLDTLKDLVLKNTNQDVSQFAKLEKADVLEMVVNYMENMQNSRSPRSGKKRTSSDCQCTSRGTNSLENENQNAKRNPKRRRILADLTNTGTCEEKENLASSSSIKNFDKNLTFPSCRTKENLSKCGRFDIRKQTVQHIENGIVKDSVKIQEETTVCEDNDCACVSPEYPSETEQGASNEPNDLNGLLPIENTNEHIWRPW